jgi:hypothetical protein
LQRRRPEIDAMPSRYFAQLFAPSMIGSGIL